jgi:hypothetical protein
MVLEGKPQGTTVSIGCLMRSLIQISISSSMLESTIHHLVIGIKVQASQGCMPLESPNFSNGHGNINSSWPDHIGKWSSCVTWPGIHVVHEFNLSRCPLDAIKLAQVKVRGLVNLLITTG